MSLSRLAVEQREKEAKTLNSFLAFSLIGSLALHIGVLSLGIGKFLSKAPQVENEPIEIAIIELPTPQKLEVEPETKADGGFITGNNRAILSNSISSKEFGVASSSGTYQEKSSPKKIAPSNASIAASGVVKVSPAPQKLSQRSSKVISTALPNQKIKLENVPSEIATPAKPVITSSPIPVAVNTSKERSSQIQQLNNQRLNNLLTQAKNSREQVSTIPNSGAITAQQGKIAANLRNQARSGVGTGNSTGNESRNGTGNGISSNNSDTGNGTGTTGKGISPNNRGMGNNTGNGRSPNNGGTGSRNNVQSGSTVATGTQNIERRTSVPESNSNSTNPGSSLGRLACRTCSKPKYPERARKRGLEGKAEISVDVDSKGNVTNVRLARTSGHAELDKAAVEQARNWKFNAPNGAAQGVTAKVDFAIEGSKKSRQNRERRRQRAAARKQPVASSQNTQTTPIVKTPANTALRRSLRRQATTPQRRVDTLPPRQAFDQPQRQRRQPSVGQTRLRESLRRSQTSSNQNKLRQSLRLYQQQSQSTPSNEP